VAAAATTGADTAMVFVPPAAVLGAAVEAIEGGCRLVVATADEMPVLDAIEVRAAARRTARGICMVRTPDWPQGQNGFTSSFCYIQGNVG
jgi:succinyl-CoA synthetase alpha subunit